MNHLTDLADVHRRNVTKHRSSGPKVKRYPNVGYQETGHCLYQMRVLQSEVDYSRRPSVATSRQSSVVIRETDLPHLHDASSNLVHVHRRVFLRQRTSVRKERQSKNDWDLRHRRKNKDQGTWRNRRANRVLTRTTGREKDPRLDVKKEMARSGN
jgi:hypothetical protein